MVLDPETALESTTLANYAPTLADNIRNKNGLLWFLRRENDKTGGAAGNGEGRSGLKVVTGGTGFREPLMYGENDTVDSYGPYEDYRTDRQEGLTHAAFSQKVVGGSIVITDLEKKQNIGEPAILNLMDTKIQQTEITMFNKTDTQLCGDGTGNASKDLGGIKHLISATPAVGTVGGIDRALYAWYRNNVDTTGTAAFNTSYAGQTLISKMYMACKNGNDTPNLLLTTDTVWGLYAVGLESRLQFLTTDQEMADAGFTNVKYRRAIMLADENIDLGYMYFINSDYLFLKVLAGGNFATTPFERRGNKFIALINLYANMTMSNAQRQGLLTAITA